MRKQAADTAPVRTSIAGAVAQTKVLHIVSGLAVGGAERSLLRLCQTLADESAKDAAKNGGVHCEVASLSQSLALADEFPRAVWRYNLRQTPWRAAQQLGALIDQAREFAPDIIQGWMYHGNLTASIVARRIRRADRPPVIWSVRHSADNLAAEAPLLRGMIWLGGSRLFAPLFNPQRVVYNSHRGWHTHTCLGYGRNASTIVPNGVDCERFAPPTAQQRLAARLRFGLAPEEVALGCVARFHPQKGIEDLLAAMAQLTPKAAPGAAGPTRRRTLLLAGEGMTGHNPELMGLISRYDLVDQVKPLGVVDDLQALYWALDGLVLPSRFGEGTPNVILEAQACGLGVVATDVGDAARLVRKPRFVAAPEDSAGLGYAIASLLGLTDEQRAELGATNAAHVREHYRATDCLARYTGLYQELLGSSAAERTGPGGARE